MYENKLATLLSDVSTLKNIGENTKLHLYRLGCKRVLDLIFHTPVKLLKKKYMPNISTIRQGDIVIFKAKIHNIDISESKKNKKKLVQITCLLPQGKFHITYFNFYPHYILKDAEINKEIIVSGKLDIHLGQIYIAHPDYICVNGDNNIPINDIIYPLTYGINNKQLAFYIHQSLNLLPEVSEWIDNAYLSKQKWQSFSSSIRALHYPSSQNDLDINSNYRRRLAYDEFLANQLAVNISRFLKNRVNGRSICGTYILRNKILKELGFSLTNGQKEAIEQITQDQASNLRMMRLLQGDVGSGKTVIALMAILNVIESGQYQTTIMAPTDILATQHFIWISKIISNANLNINVELLTGKISGSKRKNILDKLQNGEIQILIGTHALFQEKVIFHDLALIIIDEQHRFGVDQRLALINKGNNPDILAMSATPIPRTMALALYADMDITRLTEKPLGRIPIHTSIVSSKKFSEVIYSLDKIIKKNEKIYWVCPLIKDKDDDEGNITTQAAIEDRYNILSAVFPDKVTFIHGKMRATEKDNAIKDFAYGNKNIIIATTVIEVGIDVSSATVIVIENAERFGLAQLHQLRGRVGRGAQKSYCILLYGYPISKIGYERLNILKNTDDGFILAEEDLKIRGGGELLGTKQSGIPEFKLADLFHHYDLLSDANLHAKEIINKDPNLKSQQGTYLRILLRFFSYENMLKIQN